MEKNLDRRQFLTGAGALAAAGVVGSLAASSGLAVASEVGGPSEGGTSNIETGPRGRYPWPATPPVIDPADIEEEIICDVVVAGAAVGGCCAIRAAAEEGAKVVLFEKADEPSSQSSQVAVINGQAQARYGRDGMFDVDMIVDHEMDEGSYYPKRAIWAKWAKHAHEVFDWYIAAAPEEVYFCKDSAENPPEGMSYFVRPQMFPVSPNYKWEEETHPTFTTSFGISQLNFNKANVQLAVDQFGAIAYFRHAVKQLIMENGRVTGCYAYNYDTKKYKKVTASKGVVLATGCYINNKEMEAYFLPDVFEQGIVGEGRLFTGTALDPEGVPTRQGDGMVMGDWVGARIARHHAPMIHHMGNGHNGARSPFGISPFLRLDLNGKRFMCEDAPGQQTENQFEKLRDQSCYTFWDANWGQAIEWNPMAHGMPYMFAESGQGGGLATQDSVDRGVEDGSILKADTLDALLGMIDDIDRTVALASIQRYNELCHNGKDEDFGKKATRMWPIETGPFYAFKFGLAPNLTNIGGLESDEDCHTFDADRNIIPGLYVAGNMQGDRFAVQYPIAMEGVASSMCFYYGYVAGKNVVAGV